ncbi:hypothetical protein FACS1894172_18540 [Spirochaetia bacterium]|nr:hypothetical protein FACS1894172_18540 [Spirochaetia bacterium]
MVILIGGAGYVGKTLMAQNILEKYKIPYLSMDHLKMGIFRGCANCSFTPESKDTLITEKLWPIIKGIIMTNIENNQNITIEGCYFPFSINELGKEYFEKIIFFYIGFSEKYIKENFSSKIIENRNVIEKRGYEFDTALEQYIIEHNEIKTMCIKNGVKYFEINNNYDNEIKFVYKWIENEWNKK